jgi:hypothetical protein
MCTCVLERKVYRAAEDLPNSVICSILLGCDCVPESPKIYNLGVYLYQVLIVYHPYTAVWLCTAIQWLLSGIV